MKNATWLESLPVAVTLCDRDGKILEMNEKSVEVFAKDGGRDLIGTNLLDCHPEPSRSKLNDLLISQSTNCYTIEKNGIKKLIYQAPWYERGTYGGMVEFAIEIPFDLPHFVRASN
jgi:PAS domain-containing protein